MNSPEVEAVPVSVQPASSSAPEPEAPVREPLPFEDAVRVLVLLVKDGRRAGDGDLESALADVEAALAA